MNTATVACQSLISSGTVTYSYYSPYYFGSGSASRGIKSKTSSMAVNGTTTVSVFALTGYNLAQTSTDAAPTVSSGAEPSQSGSAGGLSTGAKAGIGVGVGVGALLIIGALVFYLRSRRPAPQNIPKRSAEGSEISPLAELAGRGIGNGSQSPHELHNQTDRPELLGSFTHTGELDDTHHMVPQEMDATGDHVIRNDSRSSK